MQPDRQIAEADFLRHAFDAKQVKAQVMSIGNALHKQRKRCHHRDAKHRKKRIFVFFNTRSKQKNIQNQ